MHKALSALMALAILPGSQAALILTSAPAAANVVFTDDTFNLANYTSSSVFTSPGTTFTFNQCASCGHPGAGLQLKITFPAGPSSTSAAVGLANNSFSYNPHTQGAILSIDASVDKNLTDNYPFTAVAGNTFRPLIEQDGNFYLAAIPGPGVTTPGSTGYNNISKSGLLASNFLQFDFATGSFLAANPNFDGDPMLFGLAQIFSSGTTTVSYTGEADYDNLHLTVVNATPLPAALPLFATGLGALGLFGRLRRRKAASAAA